MTSQFNRSKKSFDQKEMEDFVTRYILPNALDHDRKEKISPEVIEKMAQRGFLGAIVSEQFSGLGMDMLTFGLLNFEFGKACTAARSLITVQSMVARVFEKWGTEAQKEQWLKSLATGEKIAGFALTEPESGSDASNIQTRIDEQRSSFKINGCKKWISFGQRANLFLTFGQLKGQLCCLVVERNTPGLTITPMSGILGARGSMLAQLSFDNCEVPKTSMVGSPGFGLHPVGFTALDIGRYSIAWGAVGMAQACLEASVRYVQSRKQFGKFLSEHQLIQAMITSMIVDVKAGRLLCESAGKHKSENDPRAAREMLAAKYYAAGMVVRVTGRAVEIHGANGYSREYIVERFYRDAKIMETIEGSNQMMQIMIAKYGYHDYKD
jgi:alkylation response protein AidB-like acyl-CoA dehydrogenase